MKTLSIVIVSYNVKYFLNLCLKSLLRVVSDIDSEIIVVDNQSSDGSVRMVENFFPEVQIIVNKENVGFGSACNQGIEKAVGQYVLIINPDTIVGESLLREALSRMEKDPQTGAMGVCLIDGKGAILQESKRSIPTFWSAFTKYSGLGRLFRKVAFFNQYYAPSLGYGETGEIEVLPGAFMLIRRAVLQEIGGFDSRFFMYAEDIDLSYRISKAGYKILYAGDLKTIHFKGESTEKSLLKYNTAFYTSMMLFVRKYTGELYSPRTAKAILKTIQLVQWIQKWGSRWSFSATSGSELKIKSEVLVLSGDAGAGILLKEKFGIDSVPVRASSELLTGSGIMPLRYIPSLVQTDSACSLIFDVNGLPFDQIIQWWSLQNDRQFYLFDGEHSYLISSEDKEKRGKVYILKSGIFHKP